MLRKHRGEQKQQMPRQARKTPEITNSALAAQFERIAELLETQDANPFRVRAYRQAPRPVNALCRKSTNSDRLSSAQC